MKRVGIVVAGVLVLVQGVFATDTNWERSVAAGLNITSGNSETLAANASVSAERSGDIHEIRLRAEGNFGESTVNEIDETTTQNAKVAAVYKRKFQKFFLYSDNSLFHDKVADIDSRLIAGVGIGHRIFESDNAKLDIELGGSYINEELTNATGDDYVAVRLSARYDKKLSESSKLWLTAEYLPSVDDFDDYLLDGDVGLVAAINSSLSLRVVIQDRYDNIVSDDREKNDLSLISSIVYKL